MSLKTQLKRFRQLKRLDLYLRTGDECVAFKEVFDGLQSLTHLSLEIHPIETDFLKDIDKYLPKLQSLQIRSSFKATEATADGLNRLSRLESLRLIVGNKSIIDIIETKVKKNCRKIKSIDIEFDSSDDSDSNPD